MVSFDWTSRPSNPFAWSIKSGEPPDLLAQDRRIGREDFVLELGDDALLLVFGEFVEVVRDAPLDLLPSVGLGVFQDLLAAIAHPLQAAANGVHRRGHAALEQCHREADGAAAGGLVACGCHRLVFDVPGQLVVKVEFVAVEVEGRRADFALREELVDLARVRVGEGDQGFLGPPQVERGFVLAHGVLQALDAAVHVRVEQGQEPAEVVLVALVRRRGHEQVVVGHPGERLTQPVGVGLAVLAGGAHLVGLVHDDEIPARAEQAFAGILDERDPRDGGDDLVAFLPGVLAVVGPQHVAPDDVEFLAELVGQFALPLEGEVRRGHDQRAADQAAGLQLLEQKPRHDGLAGPRVVGEEEADAGQAQEVVVDRFELVRQRIDARDGERKERVVFVGEAEAVGLDAEPKEPGVAVEGFLVGGNGQAGQLIGGEDGVVGQAGLKSASDDFDGVTQRNKSEHLHRLRQGGAANDTPRTKRRRSRHRDRGGVDTALLIAGFGRGKMILPRN